MALIYSQYAPLFKALSDETRLKIIDMLSCGQLCACEILEPLSISQSTLSYHMKQLVDSGLVIAQKDGAWMRYSLNEDRSEDLLNFTRLITSPKTDCICHTNSIKEVLL